MLPLGKTGPPGLLQISIGVDAAKLGVIRCLACEIVDQIWLLVLSGLLLIV